MKVITQGSSQSHFILTKKNAWLLWCCQLVNIGVLTAELSLWMLAIIALCLCWQALILAKKTQNKDFSKSKQFSLIPEIPSYILKLLAIGGCLAIAISATSFGVLISMVHLLALAYVLKSFEVKNKKDLYQQVLLAIFLLATALIFQQNLLFSLVIFLLLAVNLIFLLSLYTPQQGITKSGKVVLMLLFQSSFLAIVLFIVFPRLSPFWQVPLAKSGKTGLSEHVSPGDIANLALSSELAFRVDFNGKTIPQYSQLYWRAMTLENYDGRKWSRAKSAQNTLSNNSLNKEASFTPKVEGRSIDYQVIAEASYQQWLYALAVAKTDDQQIIHKKDYTLQSSKALSHTKYYTVSSYLDAPLEKTLDNDSRQRNLKVDTNSNPRLTQLALQLKDKYSQPKQLAQAVLTMFNEQQYFYTLQPPVLIKNSLDQFFFDTKAGFCSHYASSFTYLMRAAGIPARLVTGYLGGEYNNINQDENALAGHLNIYQYDAHAWSEIWIENIGWYRVDPTAAVDPQRVSEGWSSQLLEQQSQLNNELFSLYRFKQVPWLNTLRLYFDTIDYQWTKWVIGYSSQKQYNLLKKWFGQILPWKTAALITIVLVLAMGLVSLIYKLLSLRASPKIPEVQQYYLRCIRAIEQYNITLSTGATPKALSEIVQNNMPDIADDFNQVTNFYEKLTYQNLTGQNRQAVIKQLAIQVDVLLAKLAKIPKPKK